MPASSPTTPPGEGGKLGALHTALRVLGAVVLLLMLLSILYSGWIAVVNWNSISV